MISECANGLPCVVFNHDGFGLLAELAGTDCTPADADRVLVAPLAAGGFTAIDWCICSTGIHNCRTRHGRGLTRELLERSHADNPAMWGEAAARTIFPIGDVVERYNAQEQDLLDCVIAAGHARGLRVYGNVRLNHACVPRWLEGVPGANHAGGLRKDFRDDTFHAYLLGLFEDLLAKGVDGISLDFERKAPFFPDGVPQGERFAACTRFLRAVRALTDKPLIARVAWQSEKGEPQGQQPLAWMEEGLLDAVIPATHNHEPDPYDWIPKAFFDAAKRSPRPCAVWPQLWPTPEPWNAGYNRRHAPEAVQQRSEALHAAGADGAYFFNFCCYGALQSSPKDKKRRIDMIRLNEAEWLVEPFYECTARGLAWKITGGEGVNTRLSANWQAAELTWSDASAGAMVARLACDYDIAISDTDRLCLRVSHADDQQVSLKARIDGTEQTIVDRAPGGNRFAEFEGPIHGCRLERLTIEVHAGKTGDGRVSLLWILAVDSAARSRYRERMPVFDPGWPVFLERADKPLEPLLGLFLPDGVDGLRRRAASAAYHKVWADIRKRAAAFRQSQPETGVREHLPLPQPGRYEHEFGPAVSEDGQISSAAMELCALAGLVDNDTALARVALRHVLAAAHCGHWDDSFMMTRPGALWDHRAFTAWVVVQGFVRAVDWAGSLLTPVGRELVARALSEKVLPKIDYSLRKYAYMRGNNQAIFFAAGGILAVCALGRLLERGGDGLSWYLDVLRESVRNYYLEDGGTYEGGAYHDESTSQAIAAFAVAARFLNTPLADLLPPELLRAGHYYRVMGSTAAPGCVINTSDGGRCGLRMRGGAVPALARITGDAALLNMTAQLCEPDATGAIPGAERVLAEGPELLPPPVPSAPVFEILPQTGVLCSCRPTSGDPVRLQVVGAKANAGHGHEDKGSLVLEAFGEELLIDRGTCFYGDARSELLKKAWRHNLLTPDDADGRPVAQVNPLPVAVIPHGRGDEHMLHVEIDATAAWPEFLAKWTRSITSDEPCRFRLRDLVERLAAGSVSLHFQSRFPWVARGQSWESRSGSAGVRITPAGPVARCETCEDLFDSAYTPVYRLSLHTPPGLRFDLETTIEVFK